MADGPGDEAVRSEKARRAAARQEVGAYHQEQLRILLEHVRNGFSELDAGVIDEFELDDLIHRYKRAANKLWSFCAVSGAACDRAASELAQMRGRDENVDWWEVGATRRERRREEEH